MSDGFDALIDDARTFFAELRQNNSKEWFEPRKAHYKANILKPAELLADLMAEDLGRRTGTVFKPKVFRIYRDVRFSKDKTPLNPHLHLSWFPAGAETRPGWFFGAAPDYLFLGTGIPGLQGPALARLRAAIDRDGASLQDALDTAQRDVGARLSDFGPAPLKRVPKPYDAAHPHADLLKRKALFVQADLPDDWRDAGLLPSLGTRAEGLRPVWSWLDAALAPPRG